MSIPQSEQNDPSDINPNRRIYLFRHSLKDEENGRPEMLSLRGVEIARVTGSKFLTDMPITACYASEAMRTHETVAAMVIGARLNVPRATQTANLTGATMQRWIEHCDKGSTLEKIRTAHPDFIEHAGTFIFLAFREIIHNLQQGEMALVVSHSPCCELAVKMLTGCDIRSLKPCEGVTLLIDEDGNGHIGVKVVPKKSFN